MNKTLPGRAQLDSKIQELMLVELVAACQKSFQRYRASDLNLISKRENYGVKLALMTLPRCEIVWQKKLFLHKFRSLDPNICHSICLNFNLS